MFTSNDEFIQELQFSFDWNLDTFQRRTLLRMRAWQLLISDWITLFVEELGCFFLLLLGLQGEIMQ